MPKFSHVIVLLLALFLIAFGIQQADQGSSKQDPSGAGEHPAPESASVADPSPISLEFLGQVTEAQHRSLDDMVLARTIRVLVVPSRTFYFLDGVVQRGLTYDAMTEFESFINRKLDLGTLKLDMHFIPVTRAQLIPALLAGYGDIVAANLTITPEREQQVLFSRPSMSNVREILVTGPAGPTVNILEDLSGKQVHVRLSSSYYESLLELNQYLADSGRSPIELVPADEHLEDEDLLEMVNAGLIPAIVMDAHKAEFWAQIFDEINVKSHIVLRRGADIGWAFRPGSNNLKAMADAFLKKSGAGTLLGNILLERYLEDTRYVDNALATPEMKKFNDTAHLFRKYSDQYDFDWLMVMSQAYQESRLDHSLRSRSGAVGIMQIKPSTAADKNVGIPDISSLEDNIHAGIKYLRFVRDRYFEGEDMDELNKTLFSFAAYNAGPARIARLRKQAGQQGLDPNQWFDNVEIMAARDIGRETVHYVGNIYKYWVAYRLSRETLAAAASQAAE